MSCIMWWLSLLAVVGETRRGKRRKHENHFLSLLWKQMLTSSVMVPLDMIPYSFGGESVKEKAIVAFPLSMEMLFGLSRSEWILLFSDFDEKTISGWDWTAFVVVSLTRAAVNGPAEGKYLQNINLMCYTHESFSVGNLFQKWYFHVSGRMCIALWHNIMNRFEHVVSVRSTYFPLAQQQSLVLKASPAEEFLW